MIVIFVSENIKVEHGKINIVIEFDRNIEINKLNKICFQKLNNNKAYLNLIIIVIK